MRGLRLLVLVLLVGCEAGSDGLGDYDAWCLSDIIAEPDSGIAIDAGQAPGDVNAVIDSAVEPGPDVFEPDVFEPDAIGPGPDNVGGDPDVGELGAAEQFRARIVEVMAEVPGRVISAVDAEAVLSEQPFAYHVIDVRGASEFAAGHIANAFNVPLTRLMDHVQSGAIPDGTPVLVVCKAGQQSGWANGLLNLLGYDSWSLGWGMPSWNDLSGNIWTGAVAADSALDDRWVAPSAESGDNEPPTLDSAAGSVDALVAERVDAIGRGSFRLTTWGSASSHLDDYFLLGVFGEGYTSGYLPVTHLVDPALWPENPPGLRLLPTDKTILVYDCDGQTSAAWAALLNVAGYTAFTMKFGANDLWNSELEAGCAWQPTFAGDFTTESSL